MFENQEGYLNLAEIIFLLAASGVCVDFDYQHITIDAILGITLT